MLCLLMAMSIANSAFFLYLLLPKDLPGGRAAWNYIINVDTDVICIKTVLTGSETLFQSFL